MTVALAFLAGLIIGSFLNVCIYRLPRDLSVAKPSRSFCPVCLEAQLTEMGITEQHFEDPKFQVPAEAFRKSLIVWYDNIPLLSFLSLRGRCRNCHGRIPWRYPIVEVATGVAFAVCVAALGLTLPALKYSILSAILIALTASDMEERILPDEFTIGGAIVGLVFAWFVPLERYFISMLMPYSWGEHWMSVGESLFGAALSSGSIWFVAWLYKKFRHREGLGLGDVKMIAMVGAFMGLRYALMTLIVASVFGAVIGTAFIVVAKKKSDYELPFGSFLGLAALILVMLGEVLRTASSGT